MPEFEFEFNNQDTELVISQQASTFGDTDYIRLSIYPTEAINNIVRLPGTNDKAIFYSSLYDADPNGFDINVSPFGSPLNQITTKRVGGTVDSTGTPSPNGKGGDFKFGEGTLAKSLGFQTQEDKLSAINEATRIAKEQGFDLNTPGGAKAFEKIYDPKSDIGKTLRTMIRAKAPTDVANFDMDNYVDGTLFELLPHVRNFNPTNDNLWAWVNSYKKVKGYNVLKRGDASTKEFGISLNEEGAPQIESSNTAEDAVNIKEREAQEAKEVQPRLVDNLPMNKKIEVTGVTDTYSNIVKNNLKTALAQSLPDIYAKKSKNKKVSPFVSAIKKYAGNRITGTQFATLSMMGRGGQALKNHLIDTKSTYLKGMTTTWLNRQGNICRSWDYFSGSNNA